MQDTTNYGQYPSYKVPHQEVFCTNMNLNTVHDILETGFLCKIVVIITISQTRNPVSRI
jgi:hypothetical protein